MCVCVVTWGTVVLMSCLPYNKGQVKYKVLYSRLSQRVNIWIKTKGKWTFAYNCFFLPRSASGFRFLERQFSATIGGTSSPWTPQNKWSWKPTEPTSPSRLPALLSSALPESPWEKVPAPHHINHSALTCLSLCTSRGTQLQFVLLTPGVRWVACKKYSHTEKSIGFSSCAFDLISVWGQIQAPEDICSEMPFFPVVSVRTCIGEFWQFCWQFGKKVKEISKSSLLLMTVELLSSD